MSYETSQQDLEQLFSQVGAVSEVFLPTDRDTDRPRGFAFVEFNDAASVALAIERLDGAELQGRNLRVSEAKERAPRPSFRDAAPSWAVDRSFKPPKPKGSRRNIRGRKRGF